MRTSTLILVLGMILSFGLGGCSDSTGPSCVAQPSEVIPSALGNGTPCGEPLIITLYAARSIDVGQVIVFNNTDYLTIRIQTAGGWVLNETHVAVATSLEEIPQTRSGNPKVGRFSLSARHDPPVSYDEYEIDCEYESGQTLFLAIHAAVELQDENGQAIQDEGAWADGLEFPGKNWATYFNYTVRSCEDPGEIIVSLSAESVCEYDPLLISWAPASGESTMRIELLRDDGELCSIIANYTEDTGGYVWDAIGFCNDESVPGTYGIRVIDLDTGASGESDLFMIEDCGGWGE